MVVLTHAHLNRVLREVHEVKQEPKVVGDVICPPMRQ
jgi:hypothetical protein